jgi:hypothetical protein
MLYPQPILLLLDRVPRHYGEVTDLIQQTDRLHLICFPPACPDLNPQEHVWERATPSAKAYLPSLPTLDP